MPRILKRPMFSRGGSTNKNNGIMTGLVDRKGYAEDTGIDSRVVAPTQSEIYAKEFYDQLSEIQPPKPRFNMGEMGLNLISGKYAGDGLLSSLAGSGRDPYAAYSAADDKRRSLDYNTQISAAKYGISKADAEKIRNEEEAKKLKNAMAKTSFENQKYITTQENDLLKLYKNDKSVQSFSKSSVQLKKMLSALEEDTGAGDVAAVFAFMKTLDPESVVRESEFEVAEGTGGSKLFSFEKAHQLWQKLKTGQRLTEREKQNFKNAGIAFYQADQSSIDNIRSGFENIIKDRGLNKSNIFIDNDIRPFNLETPFEVKETKGAPPSIKKEFKTEYLDVPPGTKLVDYADGYYYFELPDGRRFKTKGLK